MVDQNFFNVGLLIRDLGETTASRLWPPKSIAQSRLTVGSYIPFPLGEREHQNTGVCVCILAPEPIIIIGRSDDALGRLEVEEFCQEVAKSQSSPPQNTGFSCPSGQWWLSVSLRFLTLFTLYFAIFATTIYPSSCCLLTTQQANSYSLNTHTIAALHDPILHHLSISS